MVYLGAAAFAIVLAVPWLRGNWMIATILTIPLAGLALVCCIKDPIISAFALGLAALVWIPFASRRIFARNHTVEPQTTRAIVGIEINR